METTTEQLYDVVIFHRETRKISAVIGKRMRKWEGEGGGRNTADLRLQTAFLRINDDHDAEIIPTGNLDKGDILPK